MKNRFDVIVIGAGHAGCEAAHAAARIGAHVGLCTLSADTVAHMPCNPAVGGTAKGHLVREIDALGGLMGRAIDATGIQFKLLNRSRGPAVWSPRAQADKKSYGEWVRRTLQAEPNIEWVIGKAGRVLVENGRVVGVRTGDKGVGKNGEKKSNYQPGDWKLQVETTDEREIGRVYFEVTLVPDEGPRTYKFDTQ